MTFQFVLVFFFLDHAYSHTSDLMGEVNVWSGSCDTLSQSHRGFVKD